jgi:hypothetical protein
MPLVHMRRPIRPHVGADHAAHVQTIRPQSDRNGKSSGKLSPFMVAL